MEYKNIRSFSQRKKESEKNLLLYPNRIPVIIERCKNSKSNIGHLDKNKFLIPKTMQIFEVYNIVRKRVNLKPEIALFITFGGVLHKLNDLIGDVYSKYKDEDGLLYCLYFGENTFGS